jgi:hypothetical protein
MNERLEKLFSPEKLREKWKTKPASKAAKSQTSGLKKISDVKDVFNRVSSLILNKYEDDKRNVLKILLDNIEKDLDEFVATCRENNQSAEAGFAVLEQIHQLEDLIEAF